MVAEQVPLRDSAGELASTERGITGGQVVSEFDDYITRCARRFTSSYDEWQDFAAEVRLALLCYSGPIRHPAQFVRTVARNLAINQQAYGWGAHEVAEAELMRPGSFGASIPLVDYVRSKHIEGLDPYSGVEVRETLARLEEKLTPSESRCYKHLKQGFEQEELARLLGVTKQAVSKLICSIRRKYLAVEQG